MTLKEKKTTRVLKQIIANPGMLAPQKDTSTPRLAGWVRGNMNHKKGCL